MIDAREPQIFVRLGAQTSSSSSLFGGAGVDFAAGHPIEQFLQVFRLTSFETRQ